MPKSKNPILPTGVYLLGPELRGGLYLCWGEHGEENFFSAVLFLDGHWTAGKFGQFDQHEDFLDYIKKIQDEQEK